MARIDTVAAIEVIEKAKSLIENGWCKHSSAETEDGKKVHYTNKAATKYDMSGAIFKCCEDLNNPERDLIMFVIHGTMVLEKDHNNIEADTMIEFNDSCESKTQVIIVMDKILANLNSALIHNQ